MKPLLMILMLGLTACSSAPQVPVPKIVLPTAEPAKAEEPKDQAEPLAVGSRRYQIVAAATAEWLFFGQQQVVMDGDEERIPHVGIWEDDDMPHSERVNQYWRVVGMSRLSGYDCKEPWSAAFISWVMRSAGVANVHFPASSAHRVYLNHFLANANNPSTAFLPHLIQL